MRGAFFFLAMGLVSCSSSSFDVGSGAPEADGATEAPAETSVTEDTTGDDVGTEEDTTVLADSGAPDTRVVDSNLPDTKPPPPDTKPPPPDTSITDTAVTDTAVTDTAVTDTAVCPKPASTKMFDVSGKTECSEVYSSYGTAVQAALPCGCDADCSKQLDPNFCGCTRFVNPGNDAYQLALALSRRFSELGCSAPACPLAPCVLPTSGKCVESGTSAGKVCQNAF